MRGTSATSPTADRHLRSAEQLEWIGRLSDERDNVLAALRFTADTGDADTALRIGASMGWFWFMQGSHAEAATWLRLVVELPGDEPVAERAACLAMYSVTAWATGMLDPADAGALAERVQAAADRAKGHEERYAALAVLEPAMRMIADDHDGAMAAVDTAMSSPDVWTRATLLMMRAQLQENAGDVAGFRTNAELALAQYRLVGDRWGMATTTAALAVGRVADGDVDGGIGLFDESRRWLHELRAASDEAETLVRMASAQARAGRLEVAEALLDEAEQIARRIGATVIGAFCDYTRGELARRRGDAPAARRMLTDAVDRLARTTPGPPQMGVVMQVGLAHAEMDDGDLALARRRLVEAYELALSTRDMPVMAIVGIAVARAAWLAGDPVAAARMLGAARVVRGADDVTHDDLRELSTALRGALGDEAFGTAYDGGAAMPRDAALESFRPTLELTP